MSKGDVLVVDDDPQMVKTICDVLRRTGWHVAGALSAEDAIRCVESGTGPSAIVMDVKMRGINGLQATRALRRLRPDLPIVLITAFATAAMLEEADEHGVDHVLSKPFAFDRLLWTLDVITRVREPVLLVDDDQGFRRTISDMAILHGWPTLRARNAEIARALAATRTPKLILLDLVLGDADPIAAVRDVKQALPGVPLVLYSAHGDELARARQTLPGAWFALVIDRARVTEYLRGRIHDEQR